MLQGFWGGVILAVVNQVIVFAVLGGLLGVIVGIRMVLAWREQPVSPPPRPPVAPAARRTPSRGTRPHEPQRVAAIAAAVHAFAGAAPGTLRVVGVARVGADSLWKAVGRMEATGVEIRGGDRLQ